MTPREIEQNQGPNRRGLISLGAVGAGALALGALEAAPALAQAAAPALIDLDPVRTELVMNIVVTCSSPEPMGPSRASKDGLRGSIWPIIGGRFWGPRIRGKVVPGGADFPVLRPDGISFIDAFYRLQADDGTIIIIHNVGYGYPPDADGPRRYRLTPSFTTVKGPHDWLNKYKFIATLIAGPAFPKDFALAKGPNENDRLIQVHRVI